MCFLEKATGCNFPVYKFCANKMTHRIQIDYLSQNGKRLEN